MGESGVAAGRAARRRRRGFSRNAKYVWIYMKQTQNDNLTSDPPSALLRNTVIADYSIRTETEPTVE